MKVKLTVNKEVKTKKVYVYNNLLKARDYFKENDIFNGLQVLPYGTEIVINESLKIFYDETEYGFSGTRGLDKVYLFGEHKTGWYRVGYTTNPNENIVNLFHNVSSIEVSYIGSKFHRDPLFT